MSPYGITWPQLVTDVPTITDLAKSLLILAPRLSNWGNLTKNCKILWILFHRTLNIFFMLSQNHWALRKVNFGICGKVSATQTKCAILQTTFFNAFCVMKLWCISIPLHWNLFLGGCGDGGSLIDNKSALIEVMAWHWRGNKTLTVQVELTAYCLFNAKPLVNHWWSNFLTLSFTHRWLIARLQYLTHWWYFSLALNLRHIPASLHLDEYNQKSE